MKNNLFFNGEQLKKARIYRGYTVGELAERCGYQRQTVSMYENGKSTPIDIGVIFRLSNVLHFPPKFFTEKDKNINDGPTYFRALLTTNKKYRSQQEQKLEFVAELYEFIQDYITFPELKIIQQNAQNPPEEVAKLLRKEWQLGYRPISNLIYTVEQNGIIVTTFKTDTNDVDAFSKRIILNDEEKYFIGYSNNKTSAARIHFDIAHELGHICLHNWCDNIEELTKEEFKQRETEANLFASAFLLPAESFKKDVELNPLSIPYYKQLKEKWKVSIAAMIRRAYALKVISADDYQNLIRTMQRRSIWKVEPLDDILITSQPSLLKTAVLMLLNEKVFTPEEFVDELSYNFGLSLYADEIEFLLNLPANTLQPNSKQPFSKLSVKKPLED